MQQQNSILTLAALHCAFWFPAPKMMLMNEQLLKCPSVEWNGVPNHVVCVFPYVVSVTTDAIEIRSVVNGALLQTTCWPEMTLISSNLSESADFVRWLQQDSARKPRGNRRRKACSFSALRLVQPFIEVLFIHQCCIGKIMVGSKQSAPCTTSASRSTWIMQQGAFGVSPNKCLMQWRRNPGNSLTRSFSDLRVIS